MDGTPIIKDGAELHFLEGLATGSLQGNEVNDFPPARSNACAAEGNLDFFGGDKGPIWLVCPAIPDPTHGGVAPDAFVDTVRKPDGTPLDLQITASFNCLQKNGQFCGLADGTYRVKNENSRLYWDGASPGGSTVQLDALNTTPRAPNQLWTFTANPDGTFRIVNKASGLALTDLRGSKASGTTLVQTKADSDRDEEWIVTPVNDGFRITSASNHLAIDATSATPSPGTLIDQATPTGDTEQVWVIR